MNMARLHFITIVILGMICINSITVAAQDEKYPFTKSTVYIELGGVAGIWSLNYDRTLWNLSPNFKLQGSAGCGLISEFNGSGFPDVLLPVSVSILSGKKMHWLETGAGVTYFIWATRDPQSESGFSRKTELLKHVILGYRFQKEAGGLMFRVTYTPIFYSEGVYAYEHWMGVSIGFTLKNKVENLPSYED
jgi:hypothetical protein